MWDGDNLKNAWGTNFDLYSWNKLYEDESKEPEQDKVFIISIANIPQEACMELASLDWGTASSGLKAFYVGEENPGPIEGHSIDGEGEQNSIGAVASTVGSVVPIPMPLDIASTACGKCRDNCGFTALFE